jgi:hypothetical protein
MDPRAQGHLADLLESARRLADLSPPHVTGEMLRSTFASYAGALSALRSMDALNDEERQAWSDRMLVALGVAVPEPLPPAGPNTAIARAVYIGLPGEQVPRPEQPLPAGSFVRAIPVADAAWELAGGRFQITTVSIHEHRIEVRWYEQPLLDQAILRADDLQVAERDLEGLPDGERARRRERILQRLAGSLRIDALEDDVGTDYVVTGGGYNGGFDNRSGHQEFAPQPPPEATRLTILWQDRLIEVSLHGER